MLRGDIVPPVQLNFVIFDCGGSLLGVKLRWQASGQPYGLIVRVVQPKLSWYFIRL
jgi:hypothetical protein